MNLGFEKSSSGEVRPSLLVSLSTSSPLSLSTSISSASSSSSSSSLSGEQSISIPSPPPNSLSSSSFSTCSAPILSASSSSSSSSSTSSSSSSFPTASALGASTSNLMASCPSAASAAAAPTLETANIPPLKLTNRVDRVKHSSQPGQTSQASVKFDDIVLKLSRMILEGRLSLSPSPLPEASQPMSKSVSGSLSGSPSTSIINNSISSTGSDTVRSDNRSDESDSSTTGESIGRLSHESIPPLDKSPLMKILQMQLCQDEKNSEQQQRQCNTGLVERNGNDDNDKDDEMLRMDANGKLQDRFKSCNDGAIMSKSSTSVNENQNENINETHPIPSASSNRLKALDTLQLAIEQIQRNGEPVHIDILSIGQNQIESIQDNIASNLACNAGGIINESLAGHIVMNHFQNFDKFSLETKREKSKLLERWVLYFVSNKTSTGANNTISFEAEALRESLKDYLSNISFSGNVEFKISGLNQESIPADVTVNTHNFPTLVTPSGTLFMSVKSFFATSSNCEKMPLSPKHLTSKGTIAQRRLHISPSDNESRKILRQSPQNISTDSIFSKTTGLPKVSSPIPTLSTETPFLFPNVDFVAGTSCPESFSSKGEQKSAPSTPFKTPALSKTFVGSFEESLLHSRMSTAIGKSIPFFKAELGVIDEGRCSPHVTIPFSATFFELPDDETPAPYVSNIWLEQRSDESSCKYPNLYKLPSSGMIQLIIFNPQNTVIKVFLVKYDLKDMPPQTKTFIRQRTVEEAAEGRRATSQSGLRYLIHLKFMCVKRSVYLYNSIRVVFSHRSPDSLSSLKCITEMPKCPMYSPLSNAERLDLKSASFNARKKYIAPDNVDETDENTDSLSLSTVSM